MRRQTDRGDRGDRGDRVPPRKTVNVTESDEKGTKMAQIVTDTLIRSELLLLQIQKEGGTSLPPYPPYPPYPLGGAL